MKMEDTRTLFTEILRDRRNDDLRLAYADAIKATYPEHAELIRLQLELARLAVRGPYDRDRLPKEDREKVLLKSIGEALRASTDKRVTRAIIGRGFVQKVALNAADFPRVAFDLFTSAPITRPPATQRQGRPGGDPRERPPSRAAIHRPGQPPAHR